MSDVDIFHAPRDFEFHDFDTRNVTASDGGTATLRFPRLDADAVHALAASVRRHRAEKLARYSTDGIVDVIARAVELWTDPEYPERRLAERLIPAVTGYDASMVRIELKRYMRMFRRRELLRFVDDELNCPQMLDEYRPNRSGGYTRLYGPELSFHVFSSNVPGIPVWSMTMGLLTKSAILGKSSFDEPLMPVLFARSLASVDPDMADALAIVPWRGGCGGRVRFVAHHRGDSPARACRKAFPQLRRENRLLADRPRGASRRSVCRHRASYGDRRGHIRPAKLSGAANHVRGTWRRDVSGAGRRTACQRIGRAAAQISPFHTVRRGVHGDSAVAFHRADESADAGRAGPMAAAAGNADDAPSDDPFVVQSRSGTDWTVLYYPSIGMADSLSTPLNRTVNIVAVDHVEDALPTLRPYAQWLQTCGVALAPDRLFDVAQRVGETGIDRICPVGEMNRAKSGWHHDGGFNLLDLVHAVDIERNTDTYCDGFDMDVE